jgi:hypothetical protein
MTEVSTKRFASLVVAIYSMMHQIEDSVLAGSAKPLLREIADVCAAGHLYFFKGKFLLEKFKEFMFDDGIFKKINFKRRSAYSIISDPDARHTLTTWMIAACRAKPPATAKHFTAFVDSTFNTHITERTAQAWLNILGFRFGASNEKSYYHDGQQREDVQLALAEYIEIMAEIEKHTRTYYGPEMEDYLEPLDPIIITSDSGDDRHIHVIICYHDEASSETKMMRDLAWRMPGVTGMCKPKRGEMCMVAAYVCADFGE